MESLIGNRGAFLIIILLLCSDPFCNAQEAYQISDPRIAYNEDTLHISYDILNSDPTASYQIALLVSDANGRMIPALALQGDVGGTVPGGMNKSIKWDLEADHLYLNEKIYVELVARLNATAERSNGQQNEDPRMAGLQVDYSRETGGRGSIRNRNGSGQRTREFNRTGIVMQSLAVPGLGLSRMTGKPHWLRAVAGYGSLAGSIILNQQSLNTYNSIEDYSGFDNRHDQLQKSITLDQISEALAYTAIGIWVADFIWTLAGSTSLTEGTLSRNRKGLSITPGLDPLTYAPTVGFNYRF